MTSALRWAAMRAILMFQLEMMDKVTRLSTNHNLFEEKEYSPWLQLFFNSYFADIVFVTLLRTAVETAISEVHKLLGTGGVPASFFKIVVLAVYSLFTGRSIRTCY